MIRPARALHLVVAVGALVVVPAAPASAHVAGGSAPSNYSGVITSVSAPMPGVRVELSPSGDEIALANGSDVDVVVPGYSDEPYLRIGPEGVQRNERSPATYLQTPDSTLPPQADATAPPQWVAISQRPSVSWHDHRTHVHGDELPPAVQAAPTRQHLVTSWQIPVSYDGQPVLISGTLTWTPSPSSLPWTVLAVALVVAGVALAGRQRWQRPMLALLVGLVSADVVHLATSPLSGDAPVFTLVAGSLPTAVALLLTWASWLSVLAGTFTVAYAAGLAGWLLLIQGLSDLDALWNSQLPSAGPAWLTRLVVTISVGLGAGIALGCLRASARSRETARAR